MYGTKPDLSYRITQNKFRAFALPTLPKLPGIIIVAAEKLAYARFGPNSVPAQTPHHRAEPRVPRPPHPENPDQVVGPEVVVRAADSSLLQPREFPVFAGRLFANLLQVSGLLS